MHKIGAHPINTVDNIPCQNDSRLDDGINNSLNDNSRPCFDALHSSFLLFEGGPTGSFICE